MKLKSIHRGWLKAGWLLVLWLVVLGSPLSAQYLPTHISNQGIYLFLDELATDKVIDLHSLVKPYARKEIAALLHGADSSRLELSGRQQEELDFYLRDYMKELPAKDSTSLGTSWLWLNDDNKRFDVFYYRDSLFQMTINPM